VILKTSPAFKNHGVVKSIGTVTDVFNAILQVTAVLPLMFIANEVDALDSALNTKPVIH